MKSFLKILFFGLYLSCSSASALTCDEQDQSVRSVNKLIDSGCLKEAEQLTLRLLSISSNDAEKAKLYNSLGVAHEKQGLYDLAKEDYSRALLLFGSDPNALRLKLNLAAVLYRKGEYQAARAAYQEVLTALENPSHKNTDLESAALGGIGLVLQTLGDYATAKTQLQKALQLDRYLFGNSHAIVALDLSNLGDVHRSLGEYDQALPIYQQALEMRRNVLSSDHPDLATSLNKLGFALEMLGKTEQALALYREALKIREKTLAAGHPHIAVAHFSVADALRRLGRNEEAKASYLKALAISEKALPPKHPDIARILHYLGQLQFATGQVEPAKISLQRALSIRAESLGAFHPLTAETMSVLGSYLTTSLMQGEQRQGEKLMTQAFGIALSSGNLDVIVDAAAALTKHYAACGNQSLAIFYGKQAVNTLQRIRTQSRNLDKDLQKSLLGKNVEIYKKLSTLLIDSGRLAEAQQVLAMLKEEEYFDFIQRDSNETGLDQRASLSGAEAPWAQRYAEISNKLADIGRESSELHKKQEKTTLSTTEQSRLTALENDLEVANLAFDNMLNALIASLTDNQAKQTFSDKADDIGARQGTLTELGGDAVLLQYLVLENKISIMLTTPSIRLARAANISQSELNRLIGSYRETLRNPKLDPQPQAQALYQLLIAPVSDDLDQAQAKVIMLSLDGALRYLPFAALHDGQHYLMERYAISLYNEAAVDKLKDTNATNWKVWGLGVTQAHPGFSALNSVKSELDGIVGQAGLNGQALLDEAFNEQALKNGVAQHFPVLHIASHFKFTPGTLSDSYLLLGDDTHLSLRDVKAKHSFIGVDLVALSACETGFGGGQDVNGREVEGLGAIMQKKGAKSVMATLWPVADASTAQLMQNFYRIRQQKNLNKAEALRQAQWALFAGGKTPVNLIEERSARRSGAEEPRAPLAPKFQTNPNAPFAHPYFWAPFILMGNWL